MVAINENNYSEDRMRVFQFGYLATALASFNRSGTQHILDIFGCCDQALYDKILDDPQTISFEESCQIAWNLNMSAWKKLTETSDDFEIDNMRMEFSVERATVIRIADRMHHTKDGDPLLCDLKSIIVNASFASIDATLNEPFLFNDDQYKYFLDCGFTYNQMFQWQVDNAE